MLGKFCKKYFYTVTELTRTFGKGLCCKKEKKKDFCKVAISLQKERNNSGMAVEVMVVKCGKDPSWQKKNHYDKHNFEIHKIKCCTQRKV